MTKSVSKFKSARDKHILGPFVEMSDGARARVLNALDKRYASGQRLGFEGLNLDYELTRKLLMLAMAGDMEGVDAVFREGRRRRHHRVMPRILTTAEKMALRKRLDEMGPATQIF